MSCIQKKYIITLCGLPGVGKSSVAHFIQAHRQHLCRSHIWCASRYKYLKQSFLEFPDKTTRPDKSYFDGLFFEEVEEKLCHYDIIILDGTFHTKAKRRMVIEFAHDYGKNLIPTLIHCEHNDFDTVLQRLLWQERLGKKVFLGNCKAEKVLRKYYREFEEVTEDEGFKIIFKFDTFEQLSTLYYYQSSLQPVADTLLKLFNSRYNRWYHSHTHKIPSLSR